MNGTVVNSAGRPLPDITVFTDGGFVPGGPGTPGTTVTDEDGSFKFTMAEGPARLCYWDNSGIYAKKCWKSAKKYNDAAPFHVPHTGVLTGMGTVMTLARDVSVTRQPPGETSILNVLPVVLESIRGERTTTLLRLRVGTDGMPGGDWWLLARITSKSCDALQLAPGDELHAQIKGVALM